MKCAKIILQITMLVSVVQAARILCVFPTPFPSHQKMLRILAEEIAKQHEIVIITPEPKGQNENITEIDIGETTNERFDSDYVEIVKEFKTIALSTLQFFKTAYTIHYPIVDSNFDQENVQKLIKNKTEYFDLILIEDSPRSVTTIGARFKAPIVLVSSLLTQSDTFHHVGSETHPLLYPYCQKRPDTFLERLITFVEYLQMKWLYSYLLEKDNELIRKHFGEEAPLIEEVRKNVKMTFTCFNRMWDNCRAVTPAVTYMGAIQLKPRKTLPVDLERYLNNSQNGFIYMSLGSKCQISDLPPQILKVFLEVLASLPYDVLLKWGADDLLSKPDNVRLEKWLPQADLLYHPSIKVFITQGGLHSTDEAIAAEVPVLGLPIFADQYQNVQKYKEYGIGEVLDIDNLDEEEFRETIVKLAEDERYRENMKRYSRIVSDQRSNGLKLALHRIQYLLQYGDPFPGGAANVTPVEYFMLDVFVPLLSAFVGLMVILAMIVRFVLKTK